MNELKNKQASDSASADMALTAPSGIAEPILQYMGLEINRNSLYRKDELVAILDKYGALDSTLDEVRDTYTERFGNQLIWKYPFSDNMQGGGTVIPVQEGGFCSSPITAYMSAKAPGISCAVRSF